MIIIYIVHSTFLALIFPRPLSNLVSRCLRSLWLMVVIESPIRALKHCGLINSSNDLSVLLTHQDAHMIILYKN